eukprot:1157454-Pelagomonas_calceolata.AAC.3
MAQEQGFVNPYGIAPDRCTPPPPAGRRAQGIVLTDDSCIALRLASQCRDLHSPSGSVTCPVFFQINTSGVHKTACEPGYNIAATAVLAFSHQVDEKRSYIKSKICMTSNRKPFRGNTSNVLREGDLIVPAPPFVFDNG